MNRKLSLLTVAAFASAAISVAAQAPQTPPSSAPQTPPSSAQASSADEATFVGCVAAADTAAATPATGGSKYVLKDAKKKEGSTASSSTPGGAPSTSRPGSTGTAGTTGASRTYQLDAPDATISSEVGHMVEVVATTSDSPSSASPSASPSSASATPKLKVKTIKMIAAKCSE
jgi:hypothetical protein